MVIWIAGFSRDFASEKEAQLIHHLKSALLRRLGNSWFKDDASIHCIRSDAFPRIDAHVFIPEGCTEEVFSALAKEVGRAIAWTLQEAVVSCVVTPISPSRMWTNQGVRTPEFHHLSKLQSHQNGT